MHKNPDLVVSLGPNCRNAWNVRNWFNFERAYPFDWWITPAKSMLRMIEPGFQFSVEKDDLIITKPDKEGDENTVFNRKLNILHHHDFRRDPQRQVSAVTDADLENLNSKYQYLFARMNDDVRSASRPLFVINGLTRRLAGQLDKQALQPHGSNQIVFSEIVDAICQSFGSKSSVLVIVEGEEAMEIYGNGVFLRLPDDGTRIPKGGYAEPVNVFRRGFAKLGLPQQLTPALLDE